MDISRVVLFGSRAKNTYSLKSDIDLAVLGCDYHMYVEALEERAQRYFHLIALIFVMRLVIA